MQSIHAPYKDENGIINLGIRYSPFGEDILGDYLRIYQIDVYISIMDIWLQQAQYMGPLTKQMNIPWVAHITANSYPLSPFLATPCTYATLLVAPSKFVERTLREFFPNNVFRIPHGVDTNVFKPLPKKEKEKMREQLRISDKEFVVLSVMRNKGYQKNFPALMHAWKLLLERYEELWKKGVLLLLTDPTEPEGMRLDMLRERTGLNDVVRFIWLRPSDGTIEPTFEGDPRGMPHTANLNFPPEVMARLYNVADVHAIASSGESFSLPSIESLACGVPIIMPDNTTGPELAGESKAGLLARIGLEYTTPLISDVFHVDPHSLAECLEKFYLSKELRKRCSRRGVEFAKRYDWKRIIPMWVDLVEVAKYVQS